MVQEEEECDRVALAVHFHIGDGVVSVRSVGRVALKDDSSDESLTAGVVDGQEECIVMSRTSLNHIHLYIKRMGLVVVLVEESDVGVDGWVLALSECHSLHPEEPLEVRFLRADIRVPFIHGFLSFSGPEWPVFVCAVADHLVDIDVPPGVMDDPLLNPSGVAIVAGSRS